ncbi:MULTISPECIES: hypothetical protein [Algoriphagus]|uniref:hypothetical protein n=1 Tax=Algoriphagus TaxID=246875 RepID=UPI000403BAAE|nr:MULTISPECIES: hypothetical protein [Algoriphagus]
MEKLKAFLILHEKNRVFGFIAWQALHWIEKGMTTEEMKKEIEITIEIYSTLSFDKPVFREINFLKDMRKQLE